VAGRRDATRERARAFRHGLDELGTTCIKLGQLLSSRPDLLPDVYIEELGHLVDPVPPVPFAEIEAVLPMTSARTRSSASTRSRSRPPQHDLEDHPHAGRALIAGRRAAFSAR